MIQEREGRGDTARNAYGREKDRGGERESGREATREITPYNFIKHFQTIVKPRARINDIHLRVTHNPRSFFLYD